MKHTVFILVLLFVSVVSTACINNFAVQELNNNAKKFMDKGDTDSAICRLKSSLELDASVWETHYNLGLAYLAAEMFDMAQGELLAAISLDASKAEAYYSLAVAFEQEGDSLLDTYRESNDSEKKNNDKQVSIVTEELLKEKYNSALVYYKKYYSLITDETEQEQIEQQIAIIEEKIVAGLSLPKQLLIEN